MASLLFECIVFFSDDMQLRPRKYHNVSDLSRFKTFATLTLKGVMYYNIYNKKTREFIRQVRLTSVGIAK